MNDYDMGGEMEDRDRPWQRDAADWDNYLAVQEQADHQAVEWHKRNMRLRRQAAAELAAENAPAIPEPVSGLALITEPDSEPPWRIEGLLPAGGNVMCSAQYKAGKTTLVLNLIRSLLDGEPFLGRYPVAPPAGGAMLIDCEMGRKTMRRWITAAQVARLDRLQYVNIRGKCASFDIRVPAIRAAWAERIRQASAQVVILDPVGAVLMALGLDENSADAGYFLAAFEALLTEAGATEGVVFHHMGHAGERARGHSRLRDWPDAEWRLVRQDDSPASPRYLSAYGRDVDVAECQLDYDKAEHRLWVSGGSRNEARADTARKALLELLAAEPGISQRTILERLESGQGRHPLLAAIKGAVGDGAVLRVEGPKRAQLHWLTRPECASAHQCATGPVRTACVCASAPIEAHTLRTTQQAEVRKLDPAHTTTGALLPAPRADCTGPGRRHPARRGMQTCEEHDSMEFGAGLALTGTRG